MKVLPFVQFVVFFNYTVTLFARQIWFRHRCRENLRIKVALANPENHNFDRSVYRWYVVGKLVHYSLLLFMSLRLIIIAYLLSTNVPLISHASADPNLVHIVSHFRFFQDSITLSITALLPLYVLFIDLAESTLLDVNLTRLLTGFAVYNTEDLFRNNRNLIKPTWIVSKPLRSIQHCFEVCRTLWVHCESNWNVSRLDLQVPHLSGPHRVRLVAFTMSCELMSAILLTALLSTIALTSILLLPEYLRLLTFLNLYTIHGLLCLLDNLFGYVLLGHFFTTVFYLLQNLTIFGFLTGSHLKEQEAAVKDILSKATTNRSMMHALERSLSHFRESHCRLHHLAVYLNGHLVSRVMFTTLLMTGIISMLMIGHLIYRKMSCLEFNIFLSVIFLQVGVISFTCAFLVFVSKSLNACSQLLFQAQTRLVFMKPNSATFSLSRSLLTCKLKLMTHYELVHTGQPSTFHLGPLGGISSNSCFQFLFAYSSYLMFTFCLIRNE